MDSSSFTSGSQSNVSTTQVLDHWHDDCCVFSSRNRLGRWLFLQLNRHGPKYELKITTIFLKLRFFVYCNYIQVLSASLVE